MRINLSSFLQRRFNIFIYRKLWWKITLFYITVLGKLYFFFNRKENQKVKKAIGTVFAEGNRIRRGQKPIGDKINHPKCFSWNFISLLRKTI